MKNLIILSAILLLQSAVLAQGTRLLRQPTVSKDNIVFVHANDLWIVDREGGDAVRLTSSEGAESFPHFSPDGTQIAFTGQYDGNTDVFVIPTTGGEPKRLTWHPSDDVVQGWTPGGNKVVFRSTRKAYPTRNNKFYAVNMKGDFPEELSIPRIAYGELSPDGNFVAYIPITSWDPEWRNYRGGQAMPVWIQNLNTNELVRVPQPDKERHQDPVWYKEKVFFLSERDYANNIWSYDLNTKGYKQVTFHAQFDAKSIDACEDRIVYEQGGYLHLLTPETGEAKQLEIHVKGDLNWARVRWEDVSPNQLRNPSLSPTGQRALFEYRGEIFTVPKEHGSWRNISNSVYADRDPVWSPNGEKIAWFSDRSGEYTLMIGDQFGLESPKSIELPNQTFYFKPAWSPDGKHIAYTDTDYNLWVINLEDEKVTKVDTDGYAHPSRTMNPVWSPDSKWIAYARLMDTQFKVIKVYNVETRRNIQISDALADAISPVWDATGKYLFFLASTEWGLNTGWLDMSSYDVPANRGIYLAVLDATEPSPISPLSDEETVEEESKEGNDKDKDKAKDKDKNKDKDKDKESDLKVVIDEVGLSQRIIALNVPLKNYTGLIAGPENTLFYIENTEDGNELHKYDFEERKTEVYMPKLDFAITSKDRKQLLYRNGNTWGIVETSAKSGKSGDGGIKINMKMKVDPTAEWQQIYREAWRYQRDFLYVDNVHGAPWDKIYNWYKPWVNHVKHREDMNYIIDILGGEVSVGHSYTRGGDYPDVKMVGIGLLGADFILNNGYYQISKIYTGENWNPDLKAPLSGPGINVNEGDYLLEVNGVPLTAQINIYSLFEYTIGKNTYIKVNSLPTLNGSRQVEVYPVSNEYQLRSRDWVESNRRKVEEASDGQLGYVYLPNTGRDGYSYFNRYYFSQQDKKGMVIDERNNGGGSAADYMVDIMARKLHGYFNSKAGDKKPWTQPMAGVWGPKVMIINERAGSGGDLLPYLFRKMEIGPLIGTRTWGGLVGTWDTPPFVDGGRMVAPRGGFFDVNGEWAIEGEGIAPDIEVIQEPKLVLNGKDPQLDRAIKEALRLLETEGIELKSEPAAPVRWKRPERK